MAKRGGLGRGLGALIPDVTDEPATAPIGERTPSRVDGERIIAIDPRAIQPNPKQPRVSFDEESLQELASSIAQDGVVEPVIVRRKVDAYELVSGERRVRACILAGLDSVPAIVRDVSDADMLKIGLIENIQREDLTAVELARAYQALLDEFKWTQEVLAEQVGKKRATVSNTLRLLNLPPEVQEKVADSSISMGHARALLALPTRHAQIAACRAIIQRGLSVRQVEKMAAPTQPKRAASPRDPNIAALEDELRRRLGTRVTLHAGKGTKGRGRIEIEYYSLDDLDRILNLLRASH